jgi:hypothetical protein
MHLVQLLLALVDERAIFEAVMHELTERFGGVTAYSRAPAAGRWKSASWWARYRRGLEKRLQQKELVVRAHAIVSL